MKEIIDWLIEEIKIGCSKNDLIAIENLLLHRKGINKSVVKQFCQAAMRFTSEKVDSTISLADKLAAKLEEENIEDKIGDNITLGKALKDAVDNHSLKIQEQEISKPIELSELKQFQEALLKFLLTQNYVNSTDRAKFIGLKITLKQFFSRLPESSKVRDRLKVEVDTIEQYYHKLANETELFGNSTSVTLLSGEDNNAIAKSSNLLVNARVTEDDLAVLLRVFANAVDLVKMSFHHPSKLHEIIGLGVDFAVLSDEINKAAKEYRHQYEQLLEFIIDYPLATDEQSLDEFKFKLAIEQESLRKAYVKFLELAASSDYVKKASRLNVINLKENDLTQSALNNIKKEVEKVVQAAVSEDISEFKEEAFDENGVNKIYEYDYTLRGGRRIHFFKVNNDIIISEKGMDDDVHLFVSQVLKTKDARIRKAFTKFASIAVGQGFFTDLLIATTNCIVVNGNRLPGIANNTLQSADINFVAENNTILISAVGYIPTMRGSDGGCLVPFSSPVVIELQIALKINPDAESLEDLFLVEEQDLQLQLSALQRPDSNVTPTIDPSYLVQSNNFSEVCDYFAPHATILLDFTNPSEACQLREKFVKERSDGFSAIILEKDSYSDTLNPLEKQFFQALRKKLYITKEWSQKDAAKAIIAFVKGETIKADKIITKELSKFIKAKKVGKNDVFNNWRYLKLATLSYKVLVDLKNNGLADEKDVNAADKLVRDLSKKLSTTIKASRVKTREDIVKYGEMFSSILEYAETLAKRGDVESTKIATNIFINISEKIQKHKLVANIDSEKYLNAGKQILHARNNQAGFMRNISDNSGFEKAIFNMVKHEKIGLASAINACALPGDNPCFVGEIYTLLISAIDNKSVRKELINLLKTPKQLTENLVKEEKEKLEKEQNARDLIKFALKWQHGNFAMLHGKHPGTDIASKILKDRDILEALSGDEILSIAAGHPNLLREILEHTYRVGFSKRKVSNKIGEAQVAQLLSSPNVDDVAEILFKHYLDKITPEALTIAILNGNDETRRLILSNKKLLNKVFEIAPSNKEKVFDVTMKVTTDGKGIEEQEVKRGGGRTEYGMQEIIKKQSKFFCEALHFKSDYEVTAIPGWALAKEILGATKKFIEKGGRIKQADIKLLTNINNKLDVDAANILAAMYLSDTDTRKLILKIEKVHPQIFAAILAKADPAITHSREFVSITFAQKYDIKDTDKLVDFLAKLEALPEYEEKYKGFIDQFCKYNPEFVRKLLIPMPAKKEEAIMTAELTSSARNYGQLVTKTKSATLVIEEDKPIIEEGAALLQQEENATSVKGVTKDNKDKAAPPKSSFTFYKEHKPLPASNIASKPEEVHVRASGLKSGNK